MVVKNEDAQPNSHKFLATGSGCGLGICILMGEP